MRGALLKRFQKIGSNSERLDLDLAELHDALVVRHAIGILDAKTVLKRNAPARKLRILDAIDGLLAVENDGEARSLRGNFKGVPLAGGVRNTFEITAKGRSEEHTSELQSRRDLV